MATITAPLRETGIAFVGDVPWGTHFCHFFETKQDLLDVLLPFFKAGLGAGEFCLWVVAEPLTEEEARNALAQVVPELDRRLADGSIEIHAAGDWYLGARALDPKALMAAWDRKLARALHAGFVGMRANGSAAWLQDEHWRDFSQYEDNFNNWITAKPMIVCCSYPLATGPASAILDVARTHNFAVANRNGTWEVVETPEFRAALAENRELRARHRRQCALADLGQAAIRSSDLAALMEQAAAVAAESLGTEFSVVAELLSDGDEFRVRAGVGWKAGYVGDSLHVLGSPGRHMLRTDEPIVIDDVATEKRFAPSQILLEHGVVSVMGVIIRGRRRPWGLLSVQSARLRTFSPDDIGFLQSVANVLALAVERHEIEEAQRREKETLQAVFDNIPVMISSYDASGRLLFVNREWERVLGWSFEEARRIDVLTEVYPDPERRQEALDFIRRAEHAWIDFKPRTRHGTVIDASWARFGLSDGSVIGFGIDITERKQAERALRESEARHRQLAEKLQALSQRLLTAQEEERRRLAVELHDELGQVLTAVKISLGSLARQSGAPAPPVHLRDATASVDRAIESVRDLALDLRPSLLDDLGLGSALRSHADKFARATHIETHLAIDPVPRLPPDLEIACFRVAQEALTNVARHAHARNAWVDLHLDAQTLELKVRDDGIGFDAELARERAIGGASMGLLGMQERVALLGGEYELSVRPEGGTELRARFRLAEKASGA